MIDGVCAELHRIDTHSVLIHFSGTNPVVVARLQLGLVSLARELKADLDRIAVRADTSTSDGLHLLLQGKAAHQYPIPAWKV